MKKILSIALALVMCLSVVAILASCGQSAYDIAVKNGFKGTEQEWLASLKGEQGEKGDTGATGEKGDKGETGEKGETGAPGEKGEQGEKGDKGETGLPGANGNAGANGANGADGRKIELNVTDTHIQYRYEGETEWKNLVALDEIKGEKGDQGEAGKDGADGLTPEIGADGQWWIGGVPTGIVAGTPSEDGATVEKVVIKRMWLEATEFNVWSNWTADKAAKLVLNYELMKEGDETEAVFRTGSTVVTPSMVTGTYDLSKGGIYNITINFLGVALPATLKVASYSIQTSFFVTAPASPLALTSIVPQDNGTVLTETRLLDESEWTGTIGFGTVGSYPIKVKPEGFADYENFTVTISNMVYFATFDGIKDGLTEEEVLAATGVKFPTHVTADDWDVSVTGGRLITKVTKPTGLTGTTQKGAQLTGIVLVDSEYLSVLGASDYTVQFDLEKLGAAGGNTAFCAKYSDDNPFVTTTYAPNAIGFEAQNKMSYINLTRSFNTTGKHSTGTSGTEYYRNAAWAIGWNGSAFADARPTNFEIRKVFNFTTTDPDDETRWLGNTITVKMVVKQMVNADDTDFGFEIYIKPAGAEDSEFVKAFAMKNDNPNTTTYLNLENNLLENCVAIITGSNESTWAIDNLAIWAGIEGMPENTDASGYAALVEAAANAPELE